MSKKIDMSLGRPQPAAVASSPQQEVTLEQYQLLLQEFNRRFGHRVQNQSQFSQKLLRLKERRKGLLPTQMQFLKDGAKRKAAQCDRRAGKTYVLQQMLFETAAQYQGAVVPYIALTLDHARDLMWEPLKEITAELGMENDIEFNESLLTARFPNNARIKMVGADSPRHIRRLRGGKYPLVAIDESGEFGAHIESLIEEIIEPALMDYSGTLALVGTPGSVCDGLFYRITGQEVAPEGWSVHHWSFLDNVHIPAEERDLELILKRHPGWTRETPRFQREYLGKWVPDTGGLVYPYDEKKQHWDGKLPEGHDWIFGLGVDPGWNDATAFAVIAFAATCEDVFLVEEYKCPRLLSEQIADKIKSLNAFYKQLIIVCDPASGGKRLVEDMNQRFSLGMKVAEKQHKYDYQELLKSDLFMGHTKIDKDSALATEMRRLHWAPDKMTAGKFVETPGQPNDLCDAFLYIWRESKHWAGREVMLAPLDGTPRAEQLSKEKQLDEALRAMRERNNDEFFGFQGNG